MSSMSPPIESHHHSSTNHTPRYQIPDSDPSPAPENLGSKRRRLSLHRSVTDQPTSFRTRHDIAAAEQEEEAIESVDLTEVEGQSALDKALSKQREDAVKAQQENVDTEGGGRSTITSYKCPVCMDTPVDATTTICGHLFCHKCIIDTIRFSEGQRTDPSGKARGTCPVCRKPLTRNDSSGPKRSLVPLQLKLTTRRREAPESART